jgi:tape measure domain-containing protein
MTTERIDIVVSDNGTSRTVKRDLEALGKEALDAHSSVGILKNTFADYALRIATAIGSGEKSFSRFVGTINLSRTALGNLGATGTAALSAVASQATSTAASIDQVTKAARKASEANRALGGSGGSGGGGGSGPKAPSGGGTPANPSKATIKELNEIGLEAHAAGRSLDFLRNVMYTLQFSLIAMGVAKWADDWTNINNRLRLVATDSANLVAINERIFASAQKTRSGYADMVSMFQQLTMQAQHYGLSQAQVAQVAETVSMSSAMANTGPNAAEQSVKQLIQAMARGKVQAQELNTIMGNTPRLATAIAEGMGVTVDKLRMLNAQGKLTGTDVVQSLLKMGPKIAEEFARSTPTIAGAFTVANNAMIHFVGSMQDATGFACSWPITYSTSRSPPSASWRSCPSHSGTSPRRRSWPCGRLWRPTPSA